jgi:cytochrome c-type biogenesis protein CcmH
LASSFRSPKALGPRFRGDDEEKNALRLPRLVAFFFFWCALCTAAHAIDALPFKDRAEELRFQALTKQLRCLVCQNESLADSNAPLAADLRRDVFEQIEAGKSDEEIKAWLTSRYSDFVLYDPPLRAGTWLLWFGPALVLVVGGFAVAMIVRRRSRAAALPPTASRLPADDGDDW